MAEPHIADSGLMDRRIIDLTLTFSSEITPVPGHPRATIAPWHLHEVHARSNSLLFFSIHTGTHVDAPYHFHREGATIDQVPLDRLIRPAVLCDLRPRARSRQPVTVADLEASGLAGRSLEGTIPVLFSGWAARAWNQPNLYAEHPYLDPAAAEWLARQRISALGLDFAVDPGEPYPCHLVLLGAGIPLIENLVNLDQIGQQDFTLIALPHKVHGGNGGQARVAAML